MAWTAAMRAAMRAWAGLLLAGLLLLCLAAGKLPPAAAQQQPNRIFVTDVNGVIGVATSRHIEQAIRTAREAKAVALIVRLDTPGGLVSSMRDIIKEMIASPVPIIVYVAPSGARAASAGTFIVYGAHLAAMAPGTNIGAATPVEIGGAPGLPKSEPKETSKDAKGAAQSDSQRKAINDAVALLRSLAQLRGRS